MRFVSPSTFTHSPMPTHTHRQYGRAPRMNTLTATEYNVCIYIDISSTANGARCVCAWVEPYCGTRWNRVLALFEMFAYMRFIVRYEMPHAMPMRHDKYTIRWRETRDMGSLYRGRTERTKIMFAFGLPCISVSKEVPRLGCALKNCVAKTGKAYCKFYLFNIYIIQYTQ